MRRIKHASVKRLALCKRGKNGLRTLYKSDGTAEFATLSKGDPEKGELLAVMWPKGLADEDGDFADTQAAIDSMTSSLIANGGQLDIEHDGHVLTPKQARITEVFTIQKSDPRFQGWLDYDGDVADVTGGAAVKIQIDDPALREAYRNGEFDGVSLFGPAAVEHVDTLAASQRVAARMGGITNSENEMTPEELQAVLAAQDAKVATLVKSAVAEAVLAAKAEPKDDEPKDDEPKAEVAPTFTGDVNDPTALATYEASLRGFEMRKSIAEGNLTANDIAEMRKSLTATAPSVDELVESGIAAEESDSKEVRELQVKLFKARKSSNAPERTSKEEETAADLVKAAEDEGLEIAKLMNVAMGGGVEASGMRVLNG